MNVNDRPDVSGPELPAPEPQSPPAEVRPLVAVAILLAIGLLGLGGTWAVCSLLSPDVEPRVLPITAEEKLLLPQLGDWLKPPPGGDETFRKTQTGPLVRLEYEYAPPAVPDEAATVDPVRAALANEIAAQTPHCRVLSTVWLAADGAAAKTIYDDQLRLWLTTADRQQPSLLAYGDEALGVVLGRGGERQGNFVLCRQGRKVLLAVCTGASYGEAAALTAALTPCLDRWAAFAPAP